MVVQVEAVPTTELSLLGMPLGTAEFHVHVARKAENKGLASAHFHQLDPNRLGQMPGLPRLLIPGMLHTCFPSWEPQHSQVSPRRLASSTSTSLASTVLLFFRVHVLFPDSAAGQRRHGTRGHQTPE